MRYGIGLSSQPTGVSCVRRRTRFFPPAKFALNA